MKLKSFLVMIFLGLFSINLFAFDVAQMPPVKERVAPNADLGRVYSFYEIIKEAKKGVVNISTQKTIKAANFSGHPFFDDPFFRQFFGDAFGGGVPRDRIERSLGSGTIISSDGYIITNFHVIDSADKIIVSLPDSAKEYEAKLIGKDEKSDIAVIKIQAKNLPFLRFASSTEAQVGDVVFAIGNPFGVGESITQGIISGLNKTGIGINDYENFIQTDASINPGNSGGALVDSRGGLLGINTAILSRSGGNHGIGFAIPSEMVRKIAKALIEKGVIERGYLGVSIQDITDELKDAYKDQNGAIVVGIEDGSPAKKAGLAVWDLIVRVNDMPIKSAAELKNNIGVFNPGDSVKVSFIRNGKEQSVNVKLTKAKSEESAEADAGGIKGLQIIELNAQNRDKYDVQKGIKGVLVSKVEANSKAEEIGFRAGDVISRVENSLITNTKEFNEAIKKKGLKRVLVHRASRTFTLVVK